MTFLRQHKWWVLLLAVLLASNLVIRWPGRKNAQGPFPNGEGPPPGALGFFAEGADGDPQRQERMKAMLEKMPAEQRKVVQERIEADRVFAESIRDLPEAERREKMQEHFAQNPPPFAPGSPPPGGGGGPPQGDNPGSPQGGPGPGGGGPGMGRPIRIPPVSVRRSMDEHIANERKKAGEQ